MQQYEGRLLPASGGQCIWSVETWSQVCEHLHAAAACSTEDFLLQFSGHGSACALAFLGEDGVARAPDVGALALAWVLLELQAVAVAKPAQDSP